MNGEHCDRHGFESYWLRSVSCRKKYECQWGSKKYRSMIIELTKMCDIISLTTIKH